MQLPEPDSIAVRPTSITPMLVVLGALLLCGCGEQAAPSVRSEGDASELPTVEEPARPDVTGVAREPLEVFPPPERSDAPLRIEVQFLPVPVVVNNESVIFCPPVRRPPNPALVELASIPVGTADPLGNALRWLAQHQWPDGGWSFHHSFGACAGRCSHAGYLADNRRAATGLALLAFSACGQTHQDGAYKAVVRSGLHFLLRHEGPDGSLWEPAGGMASHGIATYALCEHYSLTHDKGLRDAAQLALNFSVASQDPIHGGWGYLPGERGDTQTFAWQLAALKSGHMAYLNVPSQSIKACQTYLDSVQALDGSRYGFRGPAARRDDTTAIGLRSRMEMGWRYDHPAMKRGVDYFSEREPSVTDVQSNYFASILLHAMGGEEWQAWKKKLQQQLFLAQERSGHAKGSWTAEGDPAFRTGGRLYATTMAVLTLKVLTNKWSIGRARKESDFKL